MLFTVQYNEKKAAELFMLSFCKNLPSPFCRKRNGAGPPHSAKGLRRMMIREKRAAPHSSSNPPSACAASAIGSTFLRRMFAIRIQV